jgi:hypothetical protein
MLQLVPVKMFIDEFSRGLLMLVSPWLTDRSKLCGCGTLSVGGEYRGGFEGTCPYSVNLLASSVVDP